MLGKYILVDHVPVSEPDTIKWAEWMEDFSNRRVAETYIADFRISTVFLGLDYGFGSGYDTTPILFETMIFGLPSNYEEYQERCSTWGEAEVQHKEACNWIMERLVRLTKEKFEEGLNMGELKEDANSK